MASIDVNPRLEIALFSAQIGLLRACRAASMTASGALEALGFGH
jgi:hypothetical protein